MKFTLSVSGDFYEKEDEINKLKEVGFTFNPDRHRFQVNDNSPEIEINTLEELMQFVNKFGNVIVKKSNSIEIYNSYRE